jgi:hypothetical protein
MQPRQLVIIVSAVLVAFGAAFGIGKLAGGSQEATATAGKPAEVIKPADATVAANVNAAGALPPLQVPQKKKKKPKQPTSSPPSTSVAPAQSATPPSSSTPRSSAPVVPRSSTPQSPPTQNTDPIQTGGGDD